MWHKRCYLLYKKLLKKKGIQYPISHKKLPSNEFVELSPDEEAQDALDRFERSKNKYLPHSFVMFELQFGVDLQEFVESVDPLRQFQAISALSRPNTLSRVKHKNQTSPSKIWREVLKYRVNFNSAALRTEKDTRDTSPEPLSVYINHDSPEYPVVIDSGASFSLTPRIEDFVTKLEPDDTTLTGLNSTTVVEGTGIVEWVIQDMFNEVRKIRVQAFYVPSASICLFSPQQYFQDNKAGSQ